MNPPFTDLGNAEAFVTEFGKDLRYCPAWRKWLVWDGQRWKVDDTGRVFRMAKKAVKRLHAESLKKYSTAVKNSTDGKEPPEAQDARRTMQFALRSQARFRLEAMVVLAQTEEGIPVTPEELDSDPWLLTVQNGTLDLKTGILRPHRRDDLITKLVPVTYDPSAECPTWIKFLIRVMGEDSALIDYLQRAVGYALTGSTKEQVLFMLHGAGANGKSTFLKTLLTLLGEYAMTTPTETLLIRRGEGPRNDLARLKGARFVSAVETEDGNRLAEALVKQMTGEDRITARFLYGEHFEFTPAFKLFFAVNHKPIIRDAGYAMWRRVRLVPFAVAIPEALRDKDLSVKLRAELPGILRWAVQGCLAWQEHGLTPPAAVMAATAAYQSEMDVFSQFIAECCELDPRQKAAAGALYDAYEAWCKDKGASYPLSPKAFAGRLLDLGLKQGKSGSVRLWKGIGFKDGTDGTNGTASSGSSYEKSSLENFPEIMSLLSDASLDAFWAGPIDYEALDQARRDLERRPRTR